MQVTQGKILGRINVVWLQIGDCGWSSAPAWWERRTSLFCVPVLLFLLFRGCHNQSGITSPVSSCCFWSGREDGARGGCAWQVRLIFQAAGRRRWPWGSAQNCKQQPRASGSGGWGQYSPHIWWCLPNEEGREIIRERCPHISAISAGCPSPTTHGITPKLLQHQMWALTLPHTESH